MLFQENIEKRLYLLVHKHTKHDTRFIGIKISTTCIMLYALVTSPKVTLICYTLFEITNDKTANINVDDVRV